MCHFTYLYPSQFDSSAITMSVLLAIDYCVSFYTHFIICRYFCKQIRTQVIRIQSWLAKIFMEISQLFIKRNRICALDCNVMLLFAMLIFESLYKYHIIKITSAHVIATSIKQVVLCNKQKWYQQQNFLAVSLRNLLTPNKSAH